MARKFEIVWDALFYDPDESEDLKRRSGYLILIAARLNGQSGNVEEKAERLGLPVEQMRDLMNGCIDKFSLSELSAIARKIGITARI